MFRETLGHRHPNTLGSINNLSLLLQAKGDLAAAEPLSREALEGLRETLGSRHPSTLNSISNLGMLLFAKGDLAAAELLLREALQGQRATLGIGHPDTLTSIITNLRWINSMLLIRWLGSTYTYMAGSCRSPSLGSLTVASCATCSAIVCIVYLY